MLTIALTSATQSSNARAHRLNGIVEVPCVPLVVLAIASTLSVRPSGAPGPINGRERRLGGDQRHALLQRDGEVLGTVRRPLGVGRLDHRQERRILGHRDLPGAFVVKVDPDENQPVDEVRPAQGDEQGDDPPVAPPDQVGRPADHAVEHGDRLVRISS